MLLLGLVLLSILAIPVQAAEREIAIIVSSTNAVDELGAEMIRRTFLKNPIRSWSGSVRIMSVDLSSDEEERRAFIRELFDMSYEDYERYWISLKYLTGDRPPKRLSDPEYFERHPGAIGFINLERVDDTLRESVKIVYTVGL